MNVDIITIIGKIDIMKKTEIDKKLEEKKKELEKKYSIKELERSNPRLTNHRYREEIYTASCSPTELIQFCNKAIKYGIKSFEFDYDDTSEIYFYYKRSETKTEYSNRLKQLQTNFIFNDLREYEFSLKREDNEHREYLRLKNKFEKI